VKNRFQNVPFKFNLHLYAEAAAARSHRRSVFRQLASVAGLYKLPESS
jgi:hypothetical protein